MGRHRANGHGDQHRPDHDRRQSPCPFPFIPEWGHPGLYALQGALMELLAIRPGRQETPAKSLVIPQGDRDAP